MKNENMSGNCRENTRNFPDAGADAKRLPASSKMRNSSFRTPKMFFNLHLSAKNVLASAFSALIMSPGFSSFP